MYLAVRITLEERPYWNGYSGASLRFNSNLGRKFEIAQTRDSGLPVCRQKALKSTPREMAAVDIWERGATQSIVTG